MATVYKVRIDVRAPQRGFMETSSAFRDQFIGPATGNRGNPAYKTLYANGELLMDYPTITMADQGSNDPAEYSTMRVEWPFTSEANRDLFFDSQHSQAAVSAEFRQTCEDAGMVFNVTKIETEE